jgi:ribosome-associated protein
MNADEMVTLVVSALEDVKATDIRQLDVRGKSNVTDRMVIATGSSSRQVRALANRVVERVKEAGERPLGVEGEGEANWVLVDLGDVVVHIMDSETRNFYGLERLWGDHSP